MHFQEVNFLSNEPYIEKKFDNAFLISRHEVKLFLQFLNICLIHFRFISCTLNIFLQKKHKWKLQMHYFNARC